MDFIPPDILAYSEAHSEPEMPLLQEINRYTNAKVLMPRMLSGHLQGLFLQFISKIHQPTTILEIGTYTGYSAISLAEGLSPQGKLITIDINEELFDPVNSFFQKSPKANQIQYLIGNALDIIPTLNHTFDLVFIDADKINYSNYYNLVFDKTSPGGLILVDNVLWSGKVLNTVKLDKDTKALIDFNNQVKADSRVETLLLPIRDGVTILRKK